MPLTPEVLRLNEQFRAMLLANERRAADAMVRYYGTGWQKLQTDINKLAEQVNAIIESGQTPTNGMITRLEQMQVIQKQVENELNKFVQFADDTVKAQQRVAIAAAERQSYELMNASFPGMIRDNVVIDFYRLPRDSVESLVGFVQDGTPLKDLIGGYVGDAVNDFTQTLVNGLIAGQGPRETARQLRNAYGMGLTKALQIARTETLRAYRTATQASYEANSDILKGWKRSAAKDDRTCMACILLDGKEYRLDEPMDDHVSGRCLCSGEMILTDKGWTRIENIKPGDSVVTHKGRYRMVLATSERSYEGTILNIRQGRHSVRLTPEHQVLVDGEWISACCLRADDTLSTLNDILVRDSICNTVQPSDSKKSCFFASFGARPLLLCQSGSCSTANISDGNAKSMLYLPTANSGIGNIPARFRAAINSASLSLCKVRQWACRVFASLRLDSFVSAALRKFVNISGLLRINRLAAMLAEIGSILHLRIKRISDLVLMPTSLVSSRYVAFCPYRRHSQSHTGSPSFNSKSRSQRNETILPRCSGVLNSPNSLAWWCMAFAVLPGSRSEISQASYSKNISRNTDSSESVHRRFIENLRWLYGNIIHHRRIKASEYSGMMYDLQVEDDHSFIAGGIVAHNCAMIPITKTYAELGIDAPEPEFNPQSGREWFEQQDETTQRKILGSGKYDAWKDGKFTLDDIPHKTPSDVWGDSWTPKSLYELLGESAPVGTYQKWLEPLEDT